MSVLATNVPCTLDSGAILSLSDRGASTAGLELCRGVEALIVSSETNDARNGASTKTRRAELDAARLVQATFGAVGRLGGRGRWLVMGLTAPLLH